MYEISGVVKSSMDGSLLSDVRIAVNGGGDIEGSASPVTGLNGAFASKYRVGEISFTVPR